MTVVATHMCFALLLVLALFLCYAAAIRNCITKYMHDHDMCVTLHVCVRCLPVVCHFDLYDVRLVATASDHFPFLFLYICLVAILYCSFSVVFSHMCVFQF